jgi:hypothetical protein
MGTRAPLYARAAPRPSAKALLEIEESVLHLTTPEGRTMRVGLAGAQFTVSDATRSQRFVRHLALRVGQQGLDLITPPEQGAIAPRALRLPVAPEHAIVIDTGVWETTVGWLQSGGRLHGLTIYELARLACVATSQFAVAIGERAASIASDMMWERRGPMRSGGDLRNTLQPFEEAARRSVRAAEALMAALAMGTLSPP